MMMGTSSTATASSVSLASPSRPGPLLYSVAIGILVLLALLMTAAFFRDATFIHVHAAGISPFQTLHFPLGTDDLGRDLLARLSVGAQISMLVGLSTALVSACIGGIYGLLSAMNEGWLDDVLMRVVDILYSLPGLMVVVLLSVFLEPYLLQVLPVHFAFGAKLFSLVAALSFFSWPEAARLIRGQTLRLKRQPFVEAVRSLGGSQVRIVSHHFLPNLLPYLFISVMVAVPRAILTESTLSFMGLGMEAPLSSWGTLVSEGWFMVNVKPYIMLESALAIGLSMWALNIVIQRHKP
jgi:oligopeptide transport system permease protein